MANQYVNLFKKNIGVAIGAGDGTITLDADYSATLPVLSAGSPMLFVIRNGSAYEIVKATLVTGAVLTVTRAQESTAAQAFVISGTTVENCDTAGTLGAFGVKADSLDQFADVAQTAGQTLSITSSTTLSGGTHSGTNTGDQTSIVGITGTLAEFNTALTGTDFATGGGTVTGASSGTNTGDQTSIVGITGTTAQFNTALSDGDFATGGGTVTGASSGTNTGDQTSIVGITGTTAQFNTAITDGQLVAGSTTHVQYNNAGVMGGNSGFNYDGTNKVGINYVAAGNALRAALADTAITPTTASAVTGFINTDTTVNNCTMVSFLSNDSGAALQRFAAIGSVNKDHTAGSFDGDFVILTAAAGNQTTEKVRVLSTGEVGIGITLPTAQLHVVGNAFVTGAIEIDGALNHDGMTVGFYNVAPVTRPTAYTQTYSTADRTHADFTSATLTDNSGGTANTTVEALADGVIYANDVAAIRNNFADLVAQNNALRADLEDLKQFVNSIADDLQAVGLAQ